MAVTPTVQRSQPLIQRLLGHPVSRVLTVLLLLFVFLLGIYGLGDGFKSLGRGVLEVFFAATANPFVGLMVGILATTLVQSSSVTTSLIVGLVAAPENPLPIANAVPMIMGANIGTTVTNTFVSLGHMGSKDEFRRAFAVATCHDFFNFITVLVLLPLELATGYLRRTATSLSSLLTGLGGADYESPIKGLLAVGITPFRSAVYGLFDSPSARAIALIIVSAALILTGLVLLVRVMRTTMGTRIEILMSLVFDRNVAVAMLIGVAITVMVQSSSITTSLLVPLAGAGVLTLTQAFPVTVGANIGTTLTALLAALGASGPNARAGLIIALVHLLFNLSGMVLVFSNSRIRNLPLSAAQWLANTAVRSRQWALVYVVVLFYGLPAIVALFNQLFR